MDTLTIQNFGKITALGNIVHHLSERYDDYYKAADAIVEKLQENEPRFRGIALELMLNGFHEEWLTKDAEETYDLDRGVYMVLRTFEELDRREKERTQFQKSAEIQQIPIDSKGRTGLGVDDLKKALQKLKYRYNPGSEPQRRALQLAIDSLEGV